MTWWRLLVLAAGVALAIYAALVGALIAPGGRQDTPAIAGFIPTASCSSGACSAANLCPGAASSCWPALIGYLALRSTSSPTSSRSPDNSPTLRSCSDRSCAAAARN
jgi:hypothetical protein